MHANCAHAIHWQNQFIFGNFRWLHEIQRSMFCKCYFGCFLSTSNRCYKFSNAKTNRKLLRFRQSIFNALAFYEFVEALCGPQTAAKHPTHFRYGRKTTQFFSMCTRCQKHTETHLLTRSFFPPSPILFHSPHRLRTNTLHAARAR